MFAMSSSSRRRRSRKNPSAAPSPTSARSGASEAIASRLMVITCWCSVLVCLPVCGLLRRNGARPREMADSRVLATARRIHIRLRVAVLRDSSHFRRFRPAAAPTVAALGTLGSSARCSGSRPLSRSLRRRSRRLRGDTRRNASSVDTPPRLATCLTTHPTNRVAACRSVRHSPPRPLPHLP